MAADDYRRKADECVARAQLATNPLDKAELLALAAKWMRLAALPTAERDLPEVIAPPSADLPSAIEPRLEC